MEGMPAARSAGCGPAGSRPGSRAASPLRLASAVQSSGPEPLREDGPGPRAWPHPGEDGTVGPMAPRPPRPCGVPLRGPSVLECKVRALKEMTAGKQGGASHEPSSEKPRCRRAKAKAGGVQAPSESSSLPQAGEVAPAQKPTSGPLDSGVSEEGRTGDGAPGPPAPGLACCGGPSPWPPEAAWEAPDHERGLRPGPGPLQASPQHRTAPGWPGERGPGKVTDVPSLKKGRPHALQDALATAGDLDSTSVASEGGWVPKEALPGGLWRAGGLGNALSLSDRVERNRLLLQEMLRDSGQSPPKAGTPAWTSSWDSAAAERPAGDITEWDSGISLQDSDQNSAPPRRTPGPKPEPRLSARQEEAKHLLQRARMKARTQPLRASHEIVPTIAPCGGDGQRGPGLEPRMTFACRDGLQNGNVSDSSSGESSGGQWPRPGTAPSHVRFEDESACDAESRYLERLQQRQRPVLSPALQAGRPGPLRSKPDLARCVTRDTPSHRPGDRPDGTSLPAPAPTEGSRRTCQSCGHRLQDGRPAEGQAPPHPRGPGELQAVPPEPPSTHGLPPPPCFLPAGAGLHLEWIRETHIGVTSCPEDRDSALDSTDTSDSCRTNGEEAGISRPSRAGRRARGSSPRPPGSGPQGALGRAQADAMGPPRRQAPRRQAGAHDAEEGDRGHAPQGAPVPQPPALDPEAASLGAQRQPGPLASHWTCPVDSWAPCGTAGVPASAVKPGPSGPGRPHPAMESQESPADDRASSLRQSHAEPPGPRLAQQPGASVSPEGWRPTPPSSRNAEAASHRKAALAAPRRQGDPGEPVGPPSLAAPTTERLSPPHSQPCGPQVRRPRLALAADSCTHRTLELQEPRGAATHEDRVQRGPCGREPEPLESSGDGITLSLEPDASQGPAGGLQGTESSSGAQGPPGTPPGPRPPSAAPAQGNRRKSSGMASALGLKKLFSALGQSSRPRLGRARSYSVEQLQPAAPGPAPPARAPGVRRAPSLQSLRLVSPSHPRLKAASFQNLHSLLSGRADRSSLYLVEAPGDSSAHGRLASAPARRTLSVEDVGAPSLPRTVGRMVEAFPDGTSQLQLQRSQEGTFGFRVASGNGRRDSGLYVQEMADLDTAKLYSGLLGVGDEILEVNGAKVAGLGLAHVQELLAHAQSLSLRVLRRRPTPR